MKRAVTMILQAILLMSMLWSAFNILPARAEGIIYIRADGSIDPPTANITTFDNITYTFTDSIYDSIVVERDNIVVDGGGYTVQGTGSGTGLSLSGRNNVTIKSMTISAFYSGIELSSSSSSSISGNNITANNVCGIVLYSFSNYNSISGNNITNNQDGIMLYSSSNSSISGNNITANDYLGIGLGYSSDISISGNTFTNDGLFVGDSYQNSVENNTVNGRPLVYLEGMSNYTVDDAGQVILVRCENIRVEGLNLSSAGVGVELWETINSSISGNNITANNVCGIGLYSSSNSSISGNTITNNGYGIRLEYFSSNSIFHNNFVNNTNQAYSYNSVNVWDDGYPSGGNYWSDYTGVDMKSGFYQNESGSDGVGDTAYSIGVAYQDNYPLVGIFNAYNVTYYTPPLVSHACNVTVISNSTISDFEAPIWIEHPEVIFLMFNASGTEGSTGFCRVSFPTAMMNGTYHVSLNGTEIPYTLLPCSNSTHSYLYFNYTHSTEEVVIIPEFPSFLILSPLFMIATLLAVIIYKRKTEPWRVAAATRRLC